LDGGAKAIVEPSGATRPTYLEAAISEEEAAGIAAGSPASLSIA
jgi:hypothetical protein